MKTKLSCANKNRLLLLFVLLLGPFLFEVHPPGNFSGYGPVLPMFLNILTFSISIFVHNGGAQVTQR